MLLRFENTAIVEIHSNAFQADYSRDLEIIGEEGTITWDFPKSKIGLYRTNSKKWQYFHYPHQRDDAFLWQAENFIKAIQGKEPIRTDITKALQTLRVCLLAKESYDRGRVMKIEGG